MIEWPSPNQTRMTRLMSFLQHFAELPDPRSHINRTYDLLDIVFLTVCTKDRIPWLANAAVHDTLRDVWAKSKAWLVGCYVLLPDHLHLFCTPRDLEIPLNRWVSFW